MDNARELANFDSIRRENHVRVSRIFLVVMPLQWLGGMVAAWWLWPATGAGGIRTQVWAALIAGGLLNALLVPMLRRYPESARTRHAVAVAQVLTSALLVQVTGGRGGTQFHLFGSLVLLALYLDWRVLASAAATVLIQDLLGGVSWGMVEHAGWAIGEAIAFGWICRQSVERMRETCAAEEHFRSICGSLPAASFWPTPATKSARPCTASSG